MNRLMLIAAVTLTACTTDGLDARVPTGPGAHDGAFMRGTLPEVDAFDDTLTQMWMDTSPGATYLEMHVQGEYGWAMVGLDLWNGQIGVGPLAPGNTVILSDDGISADDPEAPAGTVIGCSGPTMGDAWFDEPAEEVQISVDEDPETGGIVVTIVADYGNDGGVYAVTAPIGNGVRTE